METQKLVMFRKEKVKSFQKYSPAAVWFAVAANDVLKPNVRNSFSIYKSAKCNYFSRLSCSEYLF